MAGMKAQKQRRPQKLTTLFIRYTATLLAAIIALGAAIFLLYVSAEASDMIVPLFSEQAREMYASRIRGSDSVSPPAIPPNAKYAVFAPDGQWLYGIETEANARVILESYEADGADGISDIESEWMVVKMESGEVCVINLGFPSYVAFRSEVLRRMFPTPAMLFIYLFLLLAVLCFVLLALRMGRRLSKEANALLVLTERVAARDLEFDTPPPTGFYELDRVLTSMSSMRDALRESLKTQWRIEQERTEQLASLVHDLKTPLTIIRGNAELLLESGQNDQQAQYGSYILQSAERIDGYTALLREAVQAGSVAINCETIEASMLWDDITAALTSAASIKNIKTKIINECPRVKIVANRDALIRAFMNLFDNAVRQTPEGGTITLRTTLWKESLHITVEDGGSGFDGDTFTKINAPLSLDSYLSTGHGLGLHTAKSIIEQHGGELTIRNVQPSGGAVDVALPVSTDSGKGDANDPSA